MRCDCELLLHYSDCPYDGPDYTAARFDALADKLAASEAARAALVAALEPFGALAEGFSEDDADAWASAWVHVEWLLHARALAAQPAAPAPGEAPNE
jgi:hypothetical protein